MKIQHWAIIFLIIIIPFSIICRSVVNKKNLNLRDETRYNNIIDNATYDAVSQIKELADLDNMGKNVPITDAVAEATIDRFFNTLCVNFNLPLGREIGENYFARYIPAIIIVGYDGLYVYSCEKVNNEYKFVFKPKIPYSESINLGRTNGQCIINYTLDNYVKLTFTEYTFGDSYTGFNLGAKLENGEWYGTRVLEGYVGVDIDNDLDGKPDLYSGDGSVPRALSSDGYYTSELAGYYPSLCPYFLNNPAQRGGKDKAVFIKDDLASMYSPMELSYYLFQWTTTRNNEDLENNLRFLIDEYAPGDYSTHQFNGYIPSEPEKLHSFNTYTNIDADYVHETNILGLNFSRVNYDYEYDDNRNIIGEASTFHKRRRDAIINTILSVMREEFNEHNAYAKTLGITYDFSIPNISRDQWNNTIDDISVIAFMQGMPMGTDSYYNNYSLGGARIVLKTNVMGEVVKGASLSSEGSNGTQLHYVYHKAFCKCLAKTDPSAKIANGDSYEFTVSSGALGPNDVVPTYDGYLRATNQTITGYNTEGGRNTGQYQFYHVKYLSDAPQAVKEGDHYIGERYSTGIVEEFLNEADAKKKGFYACTECY